MDEDERHSVLILSYDRKKSEQLPVNVLILPLETGVAFYSAQQNEDNFLLVIFQITFEKSHPVKVNGLYDICLAFPESVRSKITSSSLVFFTPKNNFINTEQKLFIQVDETISFVLLVFSLCTDKKSRVIFISDVTVISLLLLASHYFAL